MSDDTDFDWALIALIVSGTVLRQARPGVQSAMWTGGLMLLLMMAVFVAWLVFGRK